jgi:hypothetical protein
VIEAAEDGSLLLRDLGSRNGTVYQGRRQGTVKLDGDAVVRLGHTRLRVRPSDFAVPPERTDTTMHGWEGTAPGVVGLLLIALFAAVENWISDVDGFQLMRYVLVIASGLGAGLVWSGGWALANRLFGSQARLGRHLFILGCGLTVGLLWRAASVTVAYAWSAEAVTGYGNLALLVVGWGMLYFHLTTIKPHHPRRMAATCAVLAAASVAMVLMTNLQSTGRTSDDLYMAVLLPPGARHSPDHSVDEFLAAAARLKSATDTARARGGKDGGAPDDDEDGDSDGE